jgi:hypothetical protein
MELTLFGFKATVQVSVYDKHRCLLISLVGSQQTLRSIAAGLSSRELWFDGGEQRVLVSSEHQKITALPCGSFHLLAYTPQILSGEVVIAPDMEAMADKLWQQAQRHCAVPLLPTWRDFVAQTITSTASVASYGLVAVCPNWLALGQAVQKAVQEGSL